VGSGIVLVVDDESFVRGAVNGAGAIRLYGPPRRERTGWNRCLSKTCFRLASRASRPHYAGSGQEALRQMRLMDGNIPVILSSGFNEAEAIARSRERVLPDSFKSRTRRLRSPAR
jgi:hypothetical protein